ncbi:hypothetical protein MLD38_006472 [Melastoma candidum]|uniref:Uncharacterized protein n=1 Tax=Melastoma candidum TaxID=119954 RepID=A0ACB9RPW8_9MYRT|nr:hypothetical protein MLD38_006472 [Melastoma candidum]
MCSLLATLGIDLLGGANNTIPLTYAEDIIAIADTNIACMRRASGAVLTVQERRMVPDKITMEIKGASSHVQTAQRLIQEFINGHRELTGLNHSREVLDGGARRLCIPSHNWGNPSPHSPAPKAGTVLV